jgi:hypothetical protein
MINPRLLNVSSATLLLMLITGCQPTTPGQTPAPGVGVAPLPTNHQPTAEEAVGDDPCATRLHDIMGALLTYYIQNHYSLPVRLDQLKPYADLGTELNFTCPASGQPYSYSPGGLFAPGKTKRIIVWDSTPAHHGYRWCILMPHMSPNSPIVPEVVPIPEKEFQTYVPAVQ